ncbi:MAG: hypothetical protein RIM84_05020 [Alphaproteobacteria bacterium]
MPVFWPSVYLAYFVYRALCTVLGEVVVARLTVLGDAGKYQKAEFHLEPYSFVFSTDLNANIGAIFYYLAGGSPLGISFLFMCVGTFGIIRLLKALEPDDRKAVFLLLLLPSFNVWSSVASKESVVVFAVGILLAYLVRHTRGEERLGLLELLAAYLLVVYKPHFGVSLMFLYTALMCRRYFASYNGLAIIGSLLSLTPLVAFAPVISDLSFRVQIHFIGSGDSTRELFWREPWDVFLRAFEGMYLAFVGPTVAEAAGKTVHLMSFVESLILSLGILVLVILRSRRATVFGLSVALFSIFWIMFPNYPFGAMNPGSAIRYRTDYLLIVLVIIVTILPLDSVIRRRSRDARTLAEPPTPA